MRLIAIFALFFSGLTYAEESSEAKCARQVEASISALEVIEQQTGVEQSLKDLNIEKIRSIQEEYGSCFAQKEINKRTH